MAFIRCTVVEKPIDQRDASGNITAETEGSPCSACSPSGQCMWADAHLIRRALKERNKNTRATLSVGKDKTGGMETHLET